MEISRESYPFLVAISSTVTIFIGVLYFLHVVTIDTVVSFLGLTQFFDGLNYFNNLAQFNKTNKNIGIFKIILGLILIGIVLARLIL